MGFLSDSLKAVGNAADAAAENLTNVINTVAAVSEARQLQAEGRAPAPSPSPSTGSGFDAVSFAFTPRAYDSLAGRYPNGVPESVVRELARTSSHRSDAINSEIRRARRRLKEEKKQADNTDPGLWPDAHLPFEQAIAKHGVEVVMRDPAFIQSRSVYLANQIAKGKSMREVYDALPVTTNRRDFEQFSREFGRHEELFESGVDNRNMQMPPRTTSPSPVVRPPWWYPGADTGGLKRPEDFDRPVPDNPESVFSTPEGTGEGTPAAAAAASAGAGAPASGASVSSPGQGSSAGSSGGSGSSPAPDGPAAIESEDGAVQIPGGYTLFRVDGRDVYFGYTHERMREGSQLLYRVQDPERLKAYFPSGIPPFVETTMNAATNTLSPVDGDGDPIYFKIGDSRGAEALENTSDHPFEGVEREWEILAELEPDLMSEPGYADLLVEAQLENMSPEEFRLEMRALPQFKDVSEGEFNQRVAYLSMHPDDRLRETEMEADAIRTIFQSSGIPTDGMDSVIDFMARNSMQGRYGQGQAAISHVTRQAQAIAGIRPIQDMDEDLQAVVDGLEINSLGADIEGLRNDVANYVGPYMAGMLSDSELRTWAQDIRRDPDNAVKWKGKLERMRISTLGSYGNDPNVQWSEIAAPYKQLVQNTWGEAADESDPFFFSLVQGNDLNEAGKKLRERGLQENKVGVVRDLQRTLGSTALGSQVAQTLV